jgi:hypothetical protein
VENTGHAGQQFQEIVDCSSSGGIAAEFLAQADEHKRVQCGIPAALHFEALLGQRIL